jgi:hypothetical protein
MNTFKTGDKVVIERTEGAFDYNKGKTGVVVGLDLSSDLDVHVELDEPHPDDAHDWVFSSDLELIVEMEPKP